MRAIYLIGNTPYQGLANIAVTRIEPLNPTISDKPYEAIVFTSKNAVKSIDKLYPKWKKLSVYSIGEGTSRAVKELGVQVTYEAKISYADEFAREIAPLLGGKLVLFPRAQTVVSDLGGILKKSGVLIDEILVYKSVCAEALSEIPKPDSILIFTAPSAVKCFLKLCEWSESYTAIAIGAKTAAAFAPNINALIAPKQTVASCAEFAKRLSKNCL